MNCLLGPALLSRTVLLCLAVAASAHSAAEPVVTYSIDPPNPKSGIPFRVAYHVTWQGNAQDFAVLPSDPVAVAWGTAQLVSADATSDSTGQTVTYAVEFVADRPGTFEIPAYRVSYAPGAEVFSAPIEYTPATTSHVAHLHGDASSAPAQPEVETTPIEAPAIDVRVGYYIGPTLIAALAAAGVGLIAVAAAVAVRARRARARHENPIPGAATVQSVLNLARQHRLDGKFYDYYRALAQAATLAAPSVAARKLREKLESDAQRVGYGALQPSEDDLEGALRDIERVLRETSAPTD